MSCRTIGPPLRLLVEVSRDDKHNGFGPALNQALVYLLLATGGFEV